MVDQGQWVIYGAIDSRTYYVSGKIMDNGANPVSGVKISFGLVNLGQVGEATSGTNGKFRMELTLGEYVMIPLKEGHVFDPPSVPFSLSEKGFKMDFIVSPAP